MIRIDKSIFSADELAQYEALIAKATVNPEADEEDEVDEGVPAPKKPTIKAEGVDSMEKSASPEMAAAMARLENLEKSIEMKEFSEIAKKYAPLGEKEEDLAKTLYDMKKSNEANYTAYIAILDKSLGLVEKSGIFTEIGKSTSGVPAGGVLAKVEAATTEIMKSAPDMSYDEAKAQAWIDHPELIEEYEQEFKA